MSRPCSSDLDVSPVERRVAVVGLGGSDESTPLPLFNGLVRPSSGTVTVHGTDVGRDVRALRRRVGSVFPDPLCRLVFPTPVEDVELFLRGAGVLRARRRSAALAWLEHAGIGHVDEGRRPVAVPTTEDLGVPVRGTQGAGGGRSSAGGRDPVPV